MENKTLKIVCPECKTRYRVKVPLSKAQKKTVKCRKCSHPIRISEAVHQETATQSQDVFKCPKCRQQQPESPECIKCGLVFKKYKTEEEKQLSDDGSDAAFPCDQSVQENETVFAIKRKATSIAIEYLVDHLKGTSKAVIVIVLVSFIFGGIPLFSALFGQDDEVMYFKDAAHCNQYKTFLKKTAMFQVVIGNTGENHQERVTIHLRNIPCAVEQVFYMVQNLEATSKREFDPLVRVRCNDGSLYKCRRFIGLFANSEACGTLSQLGHVKETMKEMDEENARKYWEEVMNSDDNLYNGYVLPCLGEESGDKVFEIENFAAGTLIHLGFITRDYKSYEAPWKDMRKIDVEILSDSDVVEGNPQATMFAKILNSILDVF